MREDEIVRGYELAAEQGYARAQCFLGFSYEHGHELEFLPPYSPDLNLIENKWSQAKSIRRKHECSTLELFQKYLI